MLTRPSPTAFFSFLCALSRSFFPLSSFLFLHQSSSFPSPSFSLHLGHFTTIHTYTTRVHHDRAQSIIAILCALPAILLSLLLSQQRRVGRGDSSSVGDKRPIKGTVETSTAEDNNMLCAIHERRYRVTKMKNCGLISSLNSLLLTKSHDWYYHVLYVYDIRYKVHSLEKNISLFIHNRYKLYVQLLVKWARLLHE